jgi:DNA repair exonuclease SbcCD ATPase subunit
MTEKCKLHPGKKYEAFCLEDKCDQEEHAMCSLCLIEHNRKAHGSKNVHIKDIVNERVGKIREKLIDLQPQKDKLRDHHVKVLEKSREKEKVKKALEKKLKKIKAFWEKQNEKATSQNSIMLKCHEQLVKEIAKCEHRVNENAKDPDRVEKLVNSLIKKKDYWTAYNEVQQSLKVDAVLDDSAIKAQFEKYQTLYNEYEKQYKEIEQSADVDFIAFKEMKESNEKLVDEINQLREKLKKAEADNEKFKGIEAHFISR